MKAPEQQSGDYRHSPSSRRPSRPHDLRQRSVFWAQGRAPSRLPRASRHPGIPRRHHPVPCWQPRIADSGWNPRSQVSTRTKTLGVAAAVAAIAVAIPTAVQAYADPSTTPTDTAAPTSTIPVPSVSQLPDPQGPGCDAYKNQVPTGAGSFASMGTQLGVGGHRRQPGPEHVQRGHLRRAEPGGEHRQRARRRTLRGLRADRRRVRQAGRGDADDAEERSGRADCRRSSTTWCSATSAPRTAGKMPTQQGRLVNVDRQGRRHQDQRHRQGRVQLHLQGCLHLHDRHRADPADVAIPRRRPRRAPRAPRRRRRPRAPTTSTTPATTDADATG